MPKFKVYAVKTETICAIIEADDEEEAEILADESYEDYSWSDVDGSLNTEILFGDTEEQEEEDE